MFRIENKSLPENTEGLLLTIDRYGMEGNTNGTNVMRNALPYFGLTGVKRPMERTVCRMQLRMKSGLWKNTAEESVVSVPLGMHKKVYGLSTRWKIFQITGIGQIMKTG